MAWYERVISIAGGLLLIYPGIVTDLIGLSVVVAVIVFQIIKKRKKAQITAA